MWSQFNPNPVLKGKSLKLWEWFSTWDFPLKNYENIFFLLLTKLNLKEDCLMEVSSFPREIFLFLRYRKYLAWNILRHEVDYIMDFFELKCLYFILNGLFVDIQTFFAKFYSWLKNPQNSKMIFIFPAWVQNWLSGLSLMETVGLRKIFGFFLILSVFLLF